MFTYKVLKLFCFLLVLVLVTDKAVLAQEASPPVVFYGHTLNSETGETLAGTNILNILGKGTTSNDTGYFVFPASYGDTLVFSRVGYLNTLLPVPDSLSASQRLLVFLIPDTLTLKEFLVFPWKSKEDFKKEFLAAKPDKDLSNARTNFNFAVDAANRMDFVYTDNETLQRNLIRAHSNRIVYKNQVSPENMLQPLKLIKGLVVLLKE